MLMVLLLERLIKINWFGDRLLPEMLMPISVTTKSLLYIAVTV